MHLNRFLSLGFFLVVSLKCAYGEVATIHSTQGDISECEYLSTPSRKIYFNLRNCTNPKMMDWIQSLPGGKHFPVELSNGVIEDCHFIDFDSLIFTDQSAAESRWGAICSFK